MKKVYDYYTKQLINSPKKGMLAESVTFDDIIEEKAKILHNEVELKRAVFSRGSRPIIIWEFRGNQVAQDITDICDAVGVDYCEVSARSLAGRAEELKSIYSGEEVLVIDEFTYGAPGDVDDLLAEIEDDFSPSGVTIVLVGKIDAANRNNRIFAQDFASGFINYMYSPEYDRQVVAAPKEKDDDDLAYESVAEKFARYRKLYESEEEEEDDDAESSGEGSSKDVKDDHDSEDEEEKHGSTGSDDADSEDDKKSEDSDETEDVPMTAIILTVKKDDVEKCKEELVDAGISEDAIDVIDPEDEDGEDREIKVDADYALELKDYLKGKGIDLEEKIGGEIIDDSDEKEGKESGSGDFDDFDSEFGDLFKDEDEKSEK